MQRVINALDTLALALADRGHHWSDRERGLYETAIGELTASADYGATGLSVSGKSPRRLPSNRRHPQSAPS